MKEKKIEAFIYLCKYENERPFIQVDGDRKLIVDMIVDAINQEALFIQAIGICAKAAGYEEEDDVEMEDTCDKDCNNENCECLKKEMNVKLNPQTK